MCQSTRYVGADCGESRHSVVLLNGDGKFVNKWRVENRAEALVRVVQQVCEQAGEPVTLVVESLYGFSSLLVEVARDQGLSICQASSKALAHYRDLEGQPHKDDDRDAYLLARMGWLGLEGCRLAVSATPDEHVFRRLSRLHSQLTEQRKRAKLRLRSRFLELCPAIVSPSWAGPKWSSGALLAILGRWPGFEGLEKARVGTIQRVLAKISRRPAPELEPRAKALKQLAGQISASMERSVLTLEISCWVSQIQLLSRRLQEIDQRIHQRVLADPVARKLLDMPGVGAFTAAMLSGELRPLAKTCSQAKVATYAGLTPLNRRSGIKGRNRLAKGVNKHAQQGCYMSALASLRRSSLDRAYYQKQHDAHRGHPKPHVVALLALARQRLKVFYKLLTTDAVYDKEVLIASHLQRQQALAQ